MDHRPAALLRQAFITNRDAIIDPYSAIDTLNAFKDFVSQNTTQPPQQAQRARCSTAKAQPATRGTIGRSATPHSVGSRPTVSGIPQDGNQEDIWNRSETSTLTRRSIAAHEGLSGNQKVRSNANSDMLMAVYHPAQTSMPKGRCSGTPSPSWCLKSLGLISRCPRTRRTRSSSVARSLHGSHHPAD